MINNQIAKIEKSIHEQKSKEEKLRQLKIIKEVNDCSTIPRVTLIRLTKYRKNCLKLQKKKKIF